MYSSSRRFYFSGGDFISIFVIDLKLGLKMVVHNVTQANPNNIRFHFVEYSCSFTSDAISRSSNYHQKFSNKVPSKKSSTPSTSSKSFQTAQPFGQQNTIPRWQWTQYKTYIYTKSKIFHQQFEIWQFYHQNFCHIGWCSNGWYFRMTNAGWFLNCRSISLALPYVVTATSACLNDNGRTSTVPNAANWSTSYTHTANTPNVHADTHLYSQLSSRGVVVKKPFEWDAGDPKTLRILAADQMIRKYQKILRFEYQKDVEISGRENKVSKHHTITGYLAKVVETLSLSYKICFFFKLIKTF